MSVIIIDVCSNCNVEYEYSKFYVQNNLCRQCFVNTLFDIQCNGNMRKLCENLTCRKCYEKSFSSHSLTKDWHITNKIHPRFVTKSSHSKFIFNCQCGHTYTGELGNISKGQRCSYCCDASKKFCDDTNCSHCFDKSFMSHSKIKNWNKNNKIDPRYVSKNSGKKFIFDCECGHSFEAALHHLSGSNPQWCPYCSDPSKKLCTYECDKCYHKSFSSHDKCKYLTKNNKFLPRNVFKSSRHIAEFKCEYNHIFSTPLSKISAGNWCPMCKHKTEAKLLDFLLTNNYKVTLPRPKFDWCKGYGKHYEFDYVIEDRKIIIELDGVQHFKDVLYWNSEVECILQRDMYKTKCAIEHGYSIIRIEQSNVWNDLIDWRKELINTLDACINSTVVYIVSNNPEIYDSHKNFITK